MPYSRRLWHVEEVLVDLLDPGYFSVLCCSVSRCATDCHSWGWSRISCQCAVCAGTERWSQEWLSAVCGLSCEIVTRAKGAQRVTPTSCWWDKVRSENKWIKGVTDASVLPCMLSWGVSCAMSVSVCASAGVISEYCRIYANVGIDGKFVWRVCL